MNAAEKVDYSLIPVINVARQLFGAEGRDRGTAEEKHFPDHSGLFVNIKKNRWYSHGNATGGDAISLIQFANDCDHRVAFDWLRANGYGSYLGERPAQKEIVQTYDYQDEHGDVLFQAVRFSPKDFRQRRRSNGGWEWNLKDTRRVLYRLPELLEAVGSERAVFVVEGEKSADALAKLGVPATCSPMGAGKWRDEYSPHLKGADIVILPDNDKVGEAHANDVAQSLTGVAARVRVLRLAGLPDGGDVYDWLESGGTAEQLFEAAEIADEWGKPEEKLTGWRSHVFTAAQLRTMTFSPVSYVVPGIIPEGLTILAGRPKIGKSWMALDLAIGIALGKPVLGGVYAEWDDVLYCCLEDNPRRLKRRVTKLLSPFSAEWPERLTLATKWQRLDQVGVDDIEAWCDGAVKPRLVLLDTLAGVRPSRGGNDTLYEGDYKALRDVHRFANDRGMGVVALHHTRKMDADDPVDTISGSLGLAGAADTCLILSRNSQGTTLYVRGRDIEEGERAMIFGTGNCRWTLLGDAAEVHRSDSRTKILEVLRGASDLIGPGEIADLTGLQRNNVDQLLHQMRSAGEVVRVRQGQYGHPDKEFVTTPKKPKT